MTDRPYTDDGLRSLAARIHAAAARDTDNLIRRAATRQWGQQLPAHEIDEACDALVGVLDNAADVSRWAVDLGADDLVPSTEHEITVNAGRPIARIHFAFEPDMPEDMRTNLVEGIGAAINEAGIEREEVDEHGDSDSDVFALISEIASRLRDATDSGEYHAVGLIYDLANGRTTVTDARAELEGIEFGHT